MVKFAFLCASVTNWFLRTKTSRRKRVHILRNSTLCVSMYSIYTVWPMFALFVSAVRLRYFGEGGEVS